MTTHVKITCVGPKRVFTIPQRDFTPGRPARKHAEAVTIEVGETREVTVKNGDAICIVELEN